MTVPEVPTGRPPSVLALVGTDTHPFDRFVDWLERWHHHRPTSAEPVRLLLQYGHSRPCPLPGAVPFLPHNQLHRVMTEATLVVCHGGPATITEARRTRHLPIVLPRDPARREHVDDHQQLFARRLGHAGFVRVVESETELVEAVEKGLADPLAYTLTDDPDRRDPHVTAAVAVGRIVDDLVRGHQRIRRRWWWR